MSSRRALWWCWSAWFLLGCSEIMGFEQGVPAGEGAQRAGGSGATGSSSAPGCASHAECNARWGGPYVCRSGACLDLTTSECRVVIGADALDDRIPVLLLAAFAPGSSERPWSDPATLNYQLALKEFTRDLDAWPVAARRRPVLVVCQAGAATAEQLDASFDHLTGSLQVSAVLAGMPGFELYRGVERRVVDEQNHLFLLNPSHADGALDASVPGARIWSLLPDMRSLWSTYYLLVRRVEDHLKPTLADGERAAMRLAMLVSTDDENLRALADELRPRLTINGDFAVKQVGRHYASHGVGSDSGLELQSAVRFLLDFRPHIVLSLTGSVFLARILPLLEQLWPTAEQPPPFYVLSPRHAYDPVLANLGVSLRSRIAGVHVPGPPTKTIWQDYRARFSAAYPEASGHEGSHFYYDAAYLFLYAATAAAVSAEPSGSTVSANMARVLNGLPYEVGPEDVRAAVSHLAADPANTMTLHGTWGRPYLDSNEIGAGSVYCVDASGDVQYDVLRFDTRNTKLVGGFPCFDL